MSSRRSILILGGDADGNLGDRAILTAMCEALRSIDPAVAITVVSRDPPSTSERMNVAAIRKGPRGLAALCAAAWRSELVIVGGGGLFQDDDSMVKMPYWASRCLLVRLLCQRVVGFALGVGPLRARSSRLAATFAFALMRRASVRDELARRTAQALTRKQLHVVPDPAFMLAGASDAAGVRCLQEHGVPLDDGPLVGATVRRWFPPRARWVPNVIAAKFRGTGAADAASAQLVERWAEALDRVIERTGGRVVLLPTYNDAHEGDDRLCERVRVAMTSKRVHVARVNEPQLYQAVARRLAIMVGGRMHPTIFAASVGTPVVGLAYNPKFAGLFELLGAPSNVMSVEQLVDERDVAGFAALIEAAMLEPTSPRRDGLRERSTALAQRSRAELEEALREC